MDKKYTHLQAERAIQEQWEQEQTYSRANNPGMSYTIDTPPPTVSGTLHIGHIFSYTQTDIIARYKRMSGYSVFYPFGFDDNGLPTERYVEKKKDVYAPNMKRSDFIKLCLAETKEAEQAFEKLWRAMGLSVDWSACYSTIDDRVRKISQESFIRLYKKGFIYRKHEPALFCTTCCTSVAQAELDDKEVASHFNDIVFTSSDSKPLVVGTTRPELLPSCVALLYHPHDSRYQHLKGKRAIVPVFNFDVPIMTDEDVDPEKGTGLVMVCTFGDKTDIAWYKKYNLPFKKSVGLDGKWTQNTGILAGLRVAAARAKTIEVLKEAGALVQQKAITHSVNVHERCKKEIEYVMLTQWFLNILDHKQKFIELADTINWYPSFMKPRYINWVENISWDWCLSRQRFYGIPFPAWHCTKCNEVILADSSQLPVDPQETDAPTSCPQCKGSNITPDTDIMDTWNTSSLTPFLCKSLYENHSDVFESTSFLPMSMRPQAHDIIRTWAFYTIVKAWMHQQIIPWNDIVISGHVLSDSKEKISKSRGNVRLTPENLLATYSADAIRYWTASGSLGHDVPFSDNQLKIGGKLVTKLWNAFLFTKEHIIKTPNKKPDSLGTTNEWLLHKASATFTSYQSYLEKHEFGLALSTIERFFWHDFCDNYLEIIKHQLFNETSYDAAIVTATRWTLHHVGLRILQWYAPYLPHITETIYQKLYRTLGMPKSLHQTRFEDIQISYNYQHSANDMLHLLAVIDAVRRLKTEQQLSLKTPLKTLTLVIENQDVLPVFQQNEATLFGVTQAETITYASTGTTEMIKHDGQLFATIVVDA
ncbi:valine--tRNA ligase [Candidatus Babeliales bacterium]|nr:valine--tRNA ligase [Candidatus Babeliales bacterium]